MTTRCNVAAGETETKQKKEQKMMTRTNAIDCLDNNPTATFGASVAAQLLSALHGGDVIDWRTWVSRHHGDNLTASKIRKMAKRV